jgi:hypothetical protein
MGAAISDREQRDASPLGDEGPGTDERLDGAGQPGDTPRGCAGAGPNRWPAPETALHHEPCAPERPQQRELPAPSAAGVLERPARRRDPGAWRDHIH